MTGQIAELTGQIAEQRADVAEVRTSIANLDTRLSTQIAEVRTEIGTLDTRLSIQIAGVRTEIASLETRLIRWTVGTVIATGGPTFGILRFLGYLSPKMPTPKGRATATVGTLAARTAVHRPPRRGVARVASRRARGGTPGWPPRSSFLS